METGKRRSQKPNIILVLCDDLGYGDLGCFGSNTISTPNLDSMAQQGMRMTDFYASAPWCMPSRKGLMTGVHPYRGGLDNKKILRDGTTLPEMLRTNGYTTALLGKWHLGMENGLHPIDQGFDYYYGTAGSNDPITVSGQLQVYETFKNSRSETDWPVSLNKNREVIENPAKQSLFTQRYTSEAIQIIEKSQESDTPFFIYLAHNMPHVPLFASENFLGRSKAGLYGDVVEEIDWSMGQIVKTLEEKGLQDDTLIIFTSDNGPWVMFKEFGGSAGPLRGEKGTCWEGGPRVPTIFYWPNHIEAGDSDAFMVNIDIYSTLSTLTDSQLPSEYKLDSIDMSEVLLNKKESHRHSYMFFSGVRSEHYSLPFSLRSDDYKIHFKSGDCIRDPDTYANMPVTIYDPPIVFNLKQDISESTDIAHQDPQLTSKLTNQYKIMEENLTETNYP